MEKGGKSFPRYVWRLRRHDRMDRMECDFDGNFFTRTREEDSSLSLHASREGAYKRMLKEAWKEMDGIEERVFADKELWKAMLKSGKLECTDAYDGENDADNEIDWYMDGDACRWFCLGKLPEAVMKIKVIREILKWKKTVIMKEETGNNNLAEKIDGLRREALAALWNRLREAGGRWDFNKDGRPWRVPWDIGYGWFDAYIGSIWIDDNGKLACNATAEDGDDPYLFDITALHIEEIAAIVDAIEPELKTEDENKGV